MTRYLNFSRRMNRYAKVDDVGVRIALLDTGIDATHPFMRTWELRRESFPDRGYKDFTSRDDSKTYAKDRDGHGTHCAGLILQFAPLASLYVARIAKSRASCQVDRTFNTKVAKVRTFRSRLDLDDS
jgi:subtilisin family serine protease